MFSFAFFYVLYHETAPRWHTHPHPPLLQAPAHGVEMRNWHGEDGEGTMTKKKRSHDDNQWDRTNNEETGNSSNIWRRTPGCSPSPYPMGGIWTDMEVPALCLLSSKRVVLIAATPSV